MVSDSYRVHVSGSGGTTKGRRFVLLDRDGTIIIEREYLSDPQQVELVPGASEALRRLRQIGLGLAVITNQSGVGRGYCDADRVALVHERMCALLAAEGAHLDGIYVCPHTPEDGCSCRKPNPGLAEMAAKDLGFDLGAVFVIGDKRSDIEMGQRLRATTILVRTGYGAEVAGSCTVSPDFVVDDLKAAGRTIETVLAVNGRRSKHGSDC
jgi:D-glycero-D-manno-heptose 1,7-bisphosphate phosphatase